MPEILRALAESLTLAREGMQARGHPGLLANRPASLAPQGRNTHAGVSTTVLKRGKISSPQPPLRCGSLRVGSPKTHAPIPAHGPRGAQICRPAHARGAVRVHTGCYQQGPPHAQPGTRMPTAPQRSFSRAHTRAQPCPHAPHVQISQSQAHPMQTHGDTSRNRDPHRHAATLPLMPRCRLTATATCRQMLPCTRGHVPTLASPRYDRAPSTCLAHTYSRQQLTRRCMHAPPATPSGNPRPRRVLTLPYISP